MEKQISISEKRQENISKHFNYISWDFQNSAMKRYGLFGDRPSYRIPGRFRTLRLSLLTYGPGGSEQSLKIMDNKGKRIRTIRPARFHNQQEIFYILLQEWLQRR